MNGKLENMYSSQLKQKNQNRSNMSQTNMYKVLRSSEEEKVWFKTFSSTELLSERESGKEGINVRWLSRNH